MSRVHPRYGDTVKIGDVRVESHYLRFVADELRRYAERKRRLRELEEDVIKATPFYDNTGMPRASDVSDPTHGAALRLQDSQEPTFRMRVHLRMWLRTVEDVYKRLPQEQQQVIRMLYWDKRYTIHGIATELNMSRPTVYRHRDKALFAFASHIIGEENIII